MLAKIKHSIYIKLLQKFGKINRITLAAQYLQGQGVEIGAMDLPLKLSKSSTIQYLDRCSREDSIKLFPNLSKNLVDVDIIDNGETLNSLKNDSLDFIIGNHFLEHVENPVLTLENMLRVVRPGGRLFIAIPDKRYTFDKQRVITPLDHFIKDYTEGPSWSEQEHYIDFVSNTEHGVNKSTSEILEVVEKLKQKNWSIHYHVWDHQAMIKMFCMVKDTLGFQFEILVAVAAQQDNNESIFILQKN